MGVHTFGTPCDADGLAEVAARRGVPLIVDAAPAFGGGYGDGSMIGGKGLVEVFSLSPTKPFTTGEGGVIATDDAALAREIRIGREYGNPGTFDSLFVGLNGRMPELSAALGRHHLPYLPGVLARRQALVDRYRAGLADLPGLEFQRIAPGARSTYKDLSITIDPARFGVDRDTLAGALRLEKVATRNYFDPPVHRQTAYRDVVTGPLPYSEALSGSVLAIPLFSHLDESVVDQVCAVIHRIHRHAEAVTRALHEPELVPIP
jgi:dTDP-4-amino-4,6-dideoxygalactose transaminase